MSKVKDVVVIGGGLAGLVSAISLRKKGFDISLYEKKKYPFHKVCGEFVSTEVSDYLISLDIDYTKLNPETIHKLHFSSPKGNALFIELEMPAFSISRKSFDHFLFLKAQDLGVGCYDDSEVSEVNFLNDNFEIKLMNGEEITSRCCIGAHGKRSKLDRKLNRDFFYKRSEYIGVKAHYKGDFPEHLVGLHNFRGGYCGISRVEDGIINVCYLSKASAVNKIGNIKDFEKEVLFKNPHIQHFLSSATMVFKEPLIISQMYFGKKELVENNMLMCGDAGGSITPFTGNGMAIAIRSAKICTEFTERFLNGEIDRNELSGNYRKEWNKEFGHRMWLGNIFQPLFGKALISELGFKILKLYPGLLPYLISKTHGDKI